MKLQRKNSVLFSIAIAIAMSTTGYSQSVYTSGHADIGVGYIDADQEFEPHWHLGAAAVVDGLPLLNEEEYAPDELKARTSATRTSPNGLSSTIGVPDGTTIFVAGSAAYQPNLGFSNEELNSGDWNGNITLTLTGWTLPSGAKFALYKTNFAGTNVVDRIFSTFAPGSTDFANSFEIVIPDHAHFQWGFTDLGTYTFDLTWTGTHNTHGAISTTESFTVQVVPEPSSLSLLLLACAAVLHRRRR